MYWVLLKSFTITVLDEPLGKVIFDGLLMMHTYNVTKMNEMTALPKSLASYQVQPMLVYTVHPGARENMAFGASFSSFLSDPYIIPTWDVGFLEQGSTVLEV